MGINFILCKLYFNEVVKRKTMRYYYIPVKMARMEANHTSMSNFKVAEFCPAIYTESGIPEIFDDQC